jgi:hypothetical protein
VFSFAHTIRPVKSPTADIEATDVERMYFHHFRTMSEAGLRNHLCRSASAWAASSVSALSHQDQAVKHAIIALGAAHQLSQSSHSQHGPTSQNAASGESMTELEIHMLKQYNQSMMCLQKTTDGSINDRITKTLICCLSFVCIETLRYNWRPALTHLINGLKIIDSLPIEMIEVMNTPNSTFDGADSIIEKDEIEFLFRTFTTFEVAAGLFAENFRPSISLKLYESRRLMDVQVSEPESLRGVHSLVSQFVHDTIALSWETKDHRGDLEYWARPLHGMQRSLISKRAQRVEDAVKRFMSRDGSPAPGTPDYYSVCIDIMRHKACWLIGDYLHLNNEGPQPPSMVTRFSDIISLGEVVLRGGLDQEKEFGQEPGHRSFTLDAGVVTVIYFVVRNCRDSIVQSRGLRILRDWPRRMNVWDGQLERTLFQSAAENAPTGVQQQQQQQQPLSDLPVSLNFGNAIPNLYEKLAELNIVMDD